MNPTNSELVFAVGTASQVANALLTACWSCCEVTAGTPRSVTKYRIGIALHLSVSVRVSTRDPSFRYAAAGTEAAAMQPQSEQEDAPQRPLRSGAMAARTVRRTNRAEAGVRSGAPRVTASAASPARHEHGRQYQAVTGARVDPDPEHALVQSEHVGDRRALRAQEQDGFFAGTKFGGANHHVLVAPDLPTRHFKRDDGARAALQIGCRVEADDGVDLATIVRPFRVHIGDAPVHDDLRSGDDLAELRRHEHGRAKAGYDEQTSDHGENSAHLRESTSNVSRALARDFEYRLGRTPTRTWSSQLRLAPRRDHFVPSAA